MSENPIKVFIVDDEELARKKVASLLKKFVSSGQAEIVGEAVDGVEALELLSKTDVDLLFLDVQMPGHDGFEVLERLDIENRPKVIFTTAFDQYAVKAFEENAIDYLLKPIEQDRFEKAFDKLVQQKADLGVDEEKMGELLEWLDKEQASTNPDEAKYLEQVSVPYRDKILVVSVEDIEAVEVKESITRLNVKETNREHGDVSKSYIVSQTLEQWQSRLDPKSFMRIHRSAIVRIDAIRELIPWFSGRYKVITKTGYELMASRERSKELKKMLAV